MQNFTTKNFTTENISQKIKIHNIIKSQRRKTIKIEIDDNANITLRIPVNSKNTDIIKFLESNYD
jgi:hypothetical protein